MKLLVSFSGGFDSTYIMYRLLRDTHYDITAVYFYGNHAEIAMAVPPKIEEPNISRLVAQLKNIRDFEFITKEYSREEFTDDNELLSGYIVKGERSELPVISGPINYLVWYAIPGINEGKYEVVVNGITWEQLKKKYKNKSNAEGSPKHEQAELKLKKYAPNGKLWLPLLTHEFHNKFNRWHLFKNLPEEYAKYCISCAVPVYSQDEDQLIGCGFCFKCLWDKMAKSLIDHANFTAEQIEEYRANKALEYGGGNGITAPMRLWLPVEMKSKYSYAAVKLGDERMLLNSKEKVQEYMQKKTFDYLIK